MTTKHAFIVRYRLDHWGVGLFSEKETPNFDTPEQAERWFWATGVRPPANRVKIISVLSPKGEA